MTLAPDHAMTDRLLGYAGKLRDLGAIRSELVWTAFTIVERHRFIPAVYDRGTIRITVGRDPGEELLDRIYSDTALMTHVPGDQAGGFSSASQPSLVAKMLECLQLAPAMRVLEIGAGTGYNSALITAITSAPVVTVEHSAVVAAEARAALQGTGTHAVTVTHGDGYLGDTASAPYDRIIVTCGITGISPHWPTQLARDGLILAPIAHGGLHPILAITIDGDMPRGRALLSADFMTAAGSLYQWPTGRTQVPVQPVPASALTTAPGTGPELSPDQYQDLWFYLGTQDTRTTRAVTTGIDPALGLCALHDPATGTAWIQRDGTAYATGNRAVMHSLAQHVTDWDHHARPELSQWACTFQAIGPAITPVHTPARWQLSRQE